MRFGLFVLFTCVAVLLGTAACDGKAISETEEVPATAPSNAAFSYASPESQGLSSQALDQLAEVVRGYFEQDMIVGAELVVVKNRRVVLHEAIGWKDREEQIPMVPNTLFNIRSMTKPVVGTAIQMLIDEGKLSLDDRAGEYLAAFDNEKSAEITIAHLLTHRSGLPYTRVSDLADYANIQEIARQAGEHGPGFEPGSRFEYSDSGADSLAAILAQVSGTSVGAFYEQRILGPLSMKDTLTLIDKTDPITGRIASAYVGLQGDWTRYWSPNDAPIFAFAMGSTSLYSTPIDYARFLALWIDDGRVGEQRLLSLQAIERALAPVSDMGYSINFPGLKT
jgi:CubicO group peptidase (beta-lactamase class C family)